ncbi:MAG: 2-C-methyl-D-erythritol 4-phosphate cytidylyltransferase [Candidatus Aminicenantes bacterium]|nr:2-C-methyl-D-erythritol 4-phosphate cytidylyltransferase [Candidatus Aminicenantes bacterium]
MSRVAAVVVAAGAGTRFGGAKQYAALGGRPLVEWSLSAFQGHARVDDIVLVLPQNAEKSRWTGRYSKILDVVPGGLRRQDSVRAGFDRLDAERTGLVLVHDGARPLVSMDLIDRVIEAAGKSGAAVPVVPAEDTLKEIEDRQVVRTIDRARIRRAQTPQGFAFAVLRQALASAEESSYTGTDEASLVERLGRPVAAVDGDPRNIKITTPLDLQSAEAILDANRPGI